MPTVEYTELVLVSQDDGLAVALFTPLTNCDGDLPLPCATPNEMTSEPVVRLKMVMNDARIARRVARSDVMAMVSWALAVALFRIKDQLAPLRRRVATMSYTGVAVVVGAFVVAEPRRFADVQTAAATED